ncbi:Rha family transcriptional regulator [Desulfovibrio piger]|uniref:Rha family transcriptional regulator n=1 Tax=Desulfovibrio piger TaxID=901 RepID=UPI0026EFBB6D|nr:Rha family transcriptional regulator [Desulfovibrio piger]
MTNTENTTDIIPNVILNPVNGKKIPTVSSLQVAEIFGKRHDHVLRDIRQVLTQVPEIFIKSNFGVFEYPVRRGFGTEMVKAYLLSKDGFTLLTMGYTGEKAMKFKVAYIDCFNEMEAQLANRVPDDPTALGLPDFRNPVEAAKAWALAIEEKQEVEGRLAIAEPKAAVYDEVVAPNILTLTDFCRRLEGVNIMAVKRSLCVASVFYVAPDGGYRVYARYRDTHFAEKFDKDYGSRTFHVLPEGQKLLTRLYHEGKLIMKKGFTAPSRDKGVSHAA